MGLAGWARSELVLTIPAHAHAHQTMSDVHAPDDSLYNLGVSRVSLIALLPQVVVAVASLHHIAAVAIAGDTENSEGTRCTT